VLKCAPRDEASIYRSGGVEVSALRRLRCPATLVCGGASTWLDGVREGMSTPEYYAWLAGVANGQGAGAGGGGGGGGGGVEFGPGSDGGGGCKLVMEEPCGHLLVMEAPARVAHAILSVVQQHALPAAARL
jgi:hypothetical protein